MRKYRIATVHRLVQTIRRSHELEADGIAEVAAWLARDDQPYIGQDVKPPEWTLLEATITDVTHCYKESEE